MDARELMIGDWARIRYNHFETGEEIVKDFRVGQLAKLGLGDDEPLYAWSEKSNMAKVSKVEPIPITPEILEKNFGVVERSSDGYNLVINRDLILLAFHLKATLDFWIAQPRDCPHLTYSLPLPRYVHELQHALRLFGIDKEIIL